ncbi:glycosyltransferase family 2 protein [Lactobacillus johnsonii]|nr:glycosyltransferase family 2 protein [Lactobacillus johnsonii]
MRIKRCIYMNDNEPLVSIILPVYNVEKYLSECLDSICFQTYKNFELIIVDDGSTDNSYKICKKYAEKDSRLKIIQQKNSGPAKAVMSGFNVSRGKYICFIDSDDAIEKNYLRDLVKAQIDFNVDLVISQVCNYIHGNKIMNDLDVADGYFEEEEYKDKILSKILSDGKFQSRLLPISRWGKLISRDLIAKNFKYVDEYSTYGEDLNLILPIFLDIKSIYILTNNQTNRYLYRIRATSLINAYDPNRWNSVKSGYKRLYLAFKDKNALNISNLFDQLKLDYFSAAVQCCTNEVKNPTSTYKHFKKVIYEIREDTLGWKPKIKKNKFNIAKNKILSMIYYGNNISIYNYYIMLKIAYKVKKKITREKD